MRNESDWPQMKSKSGNDWSRAMRNSGRLTKITSARDRFLLWMHKSLDVLITLTAFAVAVAIKLALWPVPTGQSAYHIYYVVALLIVVIWSVLLEYFATHELHESPDFATVCVRVFQYVTAGTITLLSVLYLMLHSNQIGRRVLLIFYVTNLVFLLIFKRVLYAARRRRDEYHRQRVLVIGSRRRAMDVLKPLVDEAVLGYRVIGCLEIEDEPGIVGKQVYGGVKVIGTLEALPEILFTQSIDEVIFAVPLTKIRHPEKYIKIAEDMGVLVRFLPEWGLYRILYDPKVAQIALSSLAGMPTLTLSSAPLYHPSLVLKHAFDRVAGTIGLVLCTPVLLAIAAAVKLTSSGPVLFRQVRSGKNGRRFVMYKFRTMVENAEQLKESLAQHNEMDGPVFKLANDPRITPLGRFLRRTSLDELPQLINIVKGEMSFVGPRPPLPKEVEKYQTWQRRRLSMKPGLTCIWQVSGRNKIGFKEWMRLDLAYIDNWSLTLDAKLLVKTVRAVLVASGDDTGGARPRTHSTQTGATESA